MAEQEVELLIECHFKTLLKKYNHYQTEDIFHKVYSKLRPFVLLNGVNLESKRSRKKNAIPNSHQKRSMTVKNKF